MFFYDNNNIFSLFDQSSFESNKYYFIHYVSNDFKYIYIKWYLYFFFFLFIFWFLIILWNYLNIWNIIFKFFGIYIYFFFKDCFFIFISFISISFSSYKWREIHTYDEIRDFDKFYIEEDFSNIMAPAAQDEIINYNDIYNDISKEFFYLYSKLRITMIIRTIYFFIICFFYLIFDYFFYFCKKSVFYTLFIPYIFLVSYFVKNIILKLFAFYKIKYIEIIWIWLINIRIHLFIFLHIDFFFTLARVFNQSLGCQYQGRGFVLESPSNFWFSYLAKFYSAKYKLAEQVVLLNVSKNEKLLITIFLLPILFLYFFILNIFLKFFYTFGVKLLTIFLFIKILLLKYFLYLEYKNIKNILKIFIIIIFSSTFIKKLIKIKKIIKIDIFLIFILFIINVFNVIVFNILGIFINFLYFFIIFLKRYRFIIIILICLYLFDLQFLLSTITYFLFYFIDFYSPIGDLFMPQLTVSLNDPFDLQILLVDLNFKKLLINDYLISRRCVLYKRRCAKWHALSLWQKFWFTRKYIRFKYRNELYHLLKRLPIIIWFIYYDLEKFWWYLYFVILEYFFFEVLKLFYYLKSYKILKYIIKLIKYLFPILKILCIYLFYLLYYIFIYNIYMLYEFFFIINWKMFYVFFFYKHCEIYQIIIWYIFTMFINITNFEFFPLLINYTVDDLIFYSNIVHFITFVLITYIYKLIYYFLTNKFFDTLYCSFYNFLNLSFYKNAFFIWYSWKLPLDIINYNYDIPQFRLKNYITNIIKGKNKFNHLLLYMLGTGRRRSSLQRHLFYINIWKFLNLFYFNFYKSNNENHSFFNLTTIQPFFRSLIFYYFFYFYYGLIFLFLFSHYYYKIFFAESDYFVNSEYAWKKFRSDEPSKIDWIFWDLTKYVKKFLKQHGVTDFIKKDNVNNFLRFSKLYKLPENKDMFMFYERLMREELISEDRNTGDRNKGFYYYGSLNRHKNLKKIFDSKLDFTDFYFDARYESFYNNLKDNHLRLALIVAYGYSRNDNIKNSFECENNLDELSETFIEGYWFYNQLYNYIKNYFFYIEKILNMKNVPIWILHKDMFSYQMVTLNVSDEEQQIFLINDGFTNPYNFIYWVFFIPYLLIYILFHKFGLIFANYPFRFEWYFYLFSYLHHFDIWTSYLDFFNRIYVSARGGRASRINTWTPYYEKKSKKWSFFPVNYYRMFFYFSHQNFMRQSSYLAIFYKGIFFQIFNILKHTSNISFYYFFFYNCMFFFWIYKLIYMKNYLLTNKYIQYAHKKIFNLWELKYYNKAVKSNLRNFIIKYGFTS